MRSLSMQTVVIQIDAPQRLSANTQEYPFEFMPYMTNRRFRAPVGTTLGDASYLPVINKISGIKFDCSDFMPRVTPIQIEIENHPGSWGFDRKFSDELDRFTIINQALKIYICNDDTEDFPNVSDLDGLYMIGRVTGVRCDTKSQTATITADLYKPVTQPLCAKPDSALPGLTLAASSQSLPFLFGENVFTKLIPLNEEIQSAPASSPIGSEDQFYFGFATDREICVAQDPFNYYIRDHFDNKYKIFVPTVFPSLADSQITKTGTFLSNYDLDTDSEICDIIKLPSESKTSRVITNLALKFEGQSTYTGTVNGAITVEIYRKSEAAPYDTSGSRPDKTPIARAVIEKTDFASEMVLNAAFYVGFTFDKPIYMDGAVGEELYYSISHDDDDDTNTLRVPRHTGTSANRWVRKSGKNWRKQASSVATVESYFYVLGCGMQPPAISTPDQNGNRARYIMVGGVGVLPSQKPFNASALDIVVQTNGLLDDASGTVSGTPDALLTTPGQLLDLLHFYYIPSTDTWESKFNESGYSAKNPSASSDYYRKAFFAIGNNATADQVIGDVCRQMQFNIVPIFSNANPVSFFAEGIYKAGYHIVTDDDIISSLYEYKNAENIVNTVEMIYGPNILTIDATDIIQRGGGRGYFGYLVDADTATRSIANFGVKALKNVTFPFINNATYAQYVADLILINYALPAEYFVIEVPFQKYGNDVEMYDQIRAFSPRFPSYFGANVGPTLPVYDDGADIEEGGIVDAEEARGQYIRGVVEAIEFITNANKPATVRYTCKRLREGNPFYE